MTIKRVLVVDVETDGLDPATDVVLEVAAVLFDVQHAEVVASYSALQVASSNRAQAINGIPATLVRSVPSVFPDGALPIGDAAFVPMLGFVEHADAYVSHRATFDRSFFPADLANRLPWVCSKFGCDWPRGRFGSHLAHLAIDHGVPVTGAHRAMGDCMLLAGIMRATHEHYAAYGRDPSGSRAWEVRALPTILEQAIERGVGNPPRCAHGADGPEPRQCPNYVRTYLRSPTLRCCPQHGGAAGWVT